MKFKSFPALVMAFALTLGFSAAIAGCSSSVSDDNNAKTDVNTVRISLFD